MFNGRSEMRATPFGNPDTAPVAPYHVSLSVRLLSACQYVCESFALSVDQPASQSVNLLILLQFLLDYTSQGNFRGVPRLDSSEAVSSATVMRGDEFQASQPMQQVSWPRGRLVYLHLASIVCASESRLDLRALVFGPGR